MEYRTLGRTELSVSLVSLGSGGPSQLGQNTGVPESEVHTLLHTALDTEKVKKFWDAPLKLSTEIDTISRPKPDQSEKIAYYLHQNSPIR